MTVRQKVAGWLFEKAVGFPIWRTFDPYPRNWPGTNLNFRAWDLSAVRACCRVLAGTIATVPFHIYQENDAGEREKFVDHPLYTKLHDWPNEHMNSAVFRQALILDYFLTGNAFAEKLTLDGKRVTALWPLCSARMSIKINGHSVSYMYSVPNGSPREYRKEEILHLKNLSFDGIIGQAPLPDTVVQHACAARTYSSTFFNNQGRPSGLLSSDQKKPAGDDSTEKMRASWDSTFSGAENAGKTAVLWAGLKYQSISVNPDDAQYNETRKQIDLEIASVFGVPAHFIGLSETPTYASAEQFNRQFVTHTVAPLAKMVEQEFNMSLFKNTPNIFCELDLDGLLRGDSIAQAQLFSSYAQNGIMSRNEIRRKINEPAREGAGELTAQINLAPVSSLGKIAATASQSIPQTSSAGGNP